MNRHQFMTGLHEAIAPRSYIEIGVNDGRGLACSTTRTIGVDPVIKPQPDRPDVQLVEATSDDFFARPDALAWFDRDDVDFTFIDGMHLFEFALRDFINAERLSTPGSVVVFDDMLPRTAPEAARDRYTTAWTGDVYKVAAVLETYRPDLVVVGLDTAPTGMVLVVGLDPTSQVLSEKYEQLLTEHVTADPQDVPAEILHRTAAADPAKVLAASVWAELAAARDAGNPPPATLRSLLELRGSARYVSDPPPLKPYPPKKPAKKATANQGQRKTAAGQSTGTPRKKAGAKPSAGRRKKTVVQRLRAAIRRRLR